MLVLEIVLALGDRPFHHLIVDFGPSFQKLFSQATQDAVQKLLPDYAEGNLASLCSWPDEMRWRYRWSSALHYIDTPDFLCNYNYDRKSASNLFRWKEA